jgi:hypothetical protein
MYTTSFLSPSIVTEQLDPTNANSIPWTHNYGSIGQDSSQYAVSSKPLHTISGLWQERFATKTNQLWFTGFNIPASNLTLSIIELQFRALRLARIQDHIIQLVYNGALVGDNIAEPSTNDLKTYGVTTAPWNSALTSSDITNTSFGVAISLRSNVLTPHTDLAYLDQVTIRITYA